MKHCLKCGEEKALDQFGKHRQKSDGLRAYCKPCNNAEARAWSAANPDKSSAQAQRWRTNNLESSRAIKRRSHEKHYDRRYAARDRALDVARAIDWAKRNPDRANANKARWAMNNPAKIRAASARRNADRVRATPPWLSAIQLAQIEEFYEIAAARNVQTGIEHHVDHIHALRGKTFNGLHVPWNLQVITAEENLRKGAKFVEVP